MLRRFVLAFLSASVVTAAVAATPAPSRVALASTGDQRWELRVNDAPYEIRGVTFTGTGGAAAYERDCAELASIGVNTIRTWGTGKDTRALLDAAHKHGLRVFLGLWFRHGQPGAEDDDRFDYLTDTAGIAAQHAAVLDAVRTHKDHPALLAWGVGNEVFLNLPNADAKLAYARVLEAACREIKLLDPHHPLIAVDAFTLGVPWVEKHCPSIDAHGINVYGPGINGVAAALAKAGSTRPWLVAEYGSRGDWDTRPDANGVKLESSDDEKYRVITDAWNTALRPHREAGRCLGLFIFNYSNSFTYTNVKHGLLLNDSKRPAWHAVREIYLGKKPASPLTRITRFEVLSHSDLPEKWLTVAIHFHTPPANAAGQAPDISFAYNFRAASARSQRDTVTLLESRPGPTPHTWLVRAPGVDGPVKLYALVRDSQNTVVTATTSLPRPLSK